MSCSLRITSWNINGAVINKRPLLCQLMADCDVLCLQEHFLSSEGLALLQLDGWVKVFGVPALSSGRGRPSGGVALLIRAELMPKSIASSDFFMSVQLLDVAVFSIYMPTDYRDLSSERKFSIACRKLANAVSEAQKQGLTVIVAGDMNCNLSDANSSRTEILLSSCPQLTVINNDLAFTYVHNSGSTSNLDFFLSTKSLEIYPSSHVNNAFSVSDHLPISNTFQVGSSNQSTPLRSHNRWIWKQEWEKIDVPTYHFVSNNILSKIKVPYFLLQTSSGLSQADKQLSLNTYCYEIVHALRIAESRAVPTRKMRIGTEIPKWNENPELSEACRRSQFWFQLWCDNGRPKVGILNNIRLYTKRKFAKCLAQHRARIIKENSARIETNPSLVWKFVKNNCGVKRSDPPHTSPSEEEWTDYYTSEFSAPDPRLEQAFENELDKRLSEPTDSTGFVVSVSTVFNAISKVKKRYSKGVDNICGLHLVNGSPMLFEHLTLLYQMIFSCGLVPDSFCVGIITPVIKKGKDPSQCSSHRPITVAPVLCKLFEILIIEEINRVCYTPSNQFGFKKGSSREHVHHIMCNILLECDRTGESIVIAGLDVSRAFDSGIHSQLLLSAYNRGLDKSVVLTFRNLYRKLVVKIKIRQPSGMKISSTIIPVRKGIRQGAISSPPFYNNSVIEAQQVVKPSFLYLGLDLSLLNYADDILNLSRSFSRFEENFAALKSSYEKIGLSFNETKTEFIVFNRKRIDPAPEVKLGDKMVKPSSSITHLGLPIGCNIKSTRLLLVSDFATKVRKAYGMLVSSKASYSREIRAQLFSAMVIPHVLALSPFWAILSDKNKRTVRSCYYRFCKYLLRVPLWKRNTVISNRYNIPDPYSVVQKRLDKFFSSLNRNELSDALSY